MRSFILFALGCLLSLNCYASYYVKVSGIDVNETIVNIHIDYYLNGNYEKLYSDDYNVAVEDYVEATFISDVQSILTDMNYYEANGPSLMTVGKTLTVGDYTVEVVSNTLVNGYVYIVVKYYETAEPGVILDTAVFKSSLAGYSEVVHKNKLLDIVNNQLEILNLNLQSLIDSTIEE